jgi:chromosome segregation ATPase
MNSKTKQTPVLLPESVQEETARDNAMTSASPIASSESPTHTSELLDRIHFLERELHEVRIGNQQQSDALVDKYELLEKQLWEVESSVAAKSSRVGSLDMSITLNDVAVEGLRVTMHNYESRLHRAEETVMQQNTMISALKAQLSSIRTIVEKHKIEMADLAWHAGKVSQVMKHLASIGEIVTTPY